MDRYKKYLGCAARSESHTEWSQATNYNIKAYGALSSALSVVCVAEQFLPDFFL
jgi:hypothetical protein